ncbi:MAG: GNAT family N-acetyltransferase [Defluviitaleaceae bacterium]|nr:GNAT family N-acetyltransferase [Defluviitaleaceae bacterium]
MPITGVIQPEIIEIEEGLRLRAYDGNHLTGLPWYQNPVVYYNSEGITDLSKIPGEEYVKGMYDWFQSNGKSEMYFIEVEKDGIFIPIGDIALQEKNPPIVIGVDEYRGYGIGKKALQAIISRARELGIKGFYETIIFDYNTASQRLYESVGFKCVEVRGKERVYELEL